MSLSLSKFLQYAAPIGLAFIPGVGPVMAGMLSGGITGLATGSLQKGLMAGLMTGGLGAGLGSLTEAAGAAGAAGEAAGTSAAGEMTGVEAAQEAATEASMQTPYENSLVGATQGASAAPGAAQAAEGSRYAALKNAVSSGNGAALSDAFLSKGGFYAGVGALGMASADAQENAKDAQWQRYNEREARRMDFMSRPAPEPAPMPSFNYEDPYESARFGRKTPYLQGFRDGGTVNIWDYLRYGHPGLPFSGGHDLSPNPGAMVGAVDKGDKSQISPLTHGHFLDALRVRSIGGLQGQSFTPTRTFAEGGLAALPGMDRDIHRRRSGAAMLRRIYPDKKSALADMRTPDSPIAKMGITDAGDPLLSAAFPEDSGIGRLVTGPGDGKSDSIPAMIDGTQPAALSSGEFVIPAEAVSAMGRGSNEAGARKLQMMVNRVKPKRSAG